MSNQMEQEKKPLFSRTPLVGVAIMVVVVSGLIVDTTRAENDNFYADLIRLDNVATRIHQNYVEEISSKELVDKAVEGMMEVLDPHTTYFEQKAYEELRIHTEGKFGGLGIQISIRDDVLTVMTPISGTPAERAGIRSGDQILEIEGESTKGIKLDEAVNRLRGEPGSEVEILIGRKGEPRPMTYTITREVIRINAVPFAGILQDGIGYIRLTTFSQDAGDELEKSIKKLLKKDLQGLVLDLRGNPGGLLPQAIEVASKFLPRKSLVVYTRGRAPNQNKDFHVSSNPVMPMDIPLVVLVNRASASASEIVAGAVQDWDRGVVLGDTTFGKGSVQTIMQLDPTHHLKLTTAFYYTPSGRCINRPENTPHSVEEEDVSVDGYQGIDDISPDQEQEQSDTSATDTTATAEDTTTYRTKSGRIVHGGGGIVPDTVVDMNSFSQIVKTLFKNDVFFKFANVEHPKLKKRDVKIGEDFVVDDRIMNEFRAYLDSTDFDYKSRGELALDDFRTRTGLVEDTTVDSTEVQADEEAEWTAEQQQQLEKAVAGISAILEQKESEEFQEHEKEIRKHLREAMLVREFGSDNETVYRFRLSDDPQVKEAIRLMAKDKIYSSLLVP